ncbi:DUF2569 family protein [Paenibacillus sp. FSL M7-0547]|uniref:DUF2569 family protein n=1 Tax=Paenibacillus sp. FSL M7-0547 TaxID=2954755 RepID=UPI0030FA3029
MSKIFTIFGIVIGTVFYKYYFDGFGNFFAILFVAGHGAIAALIGYIIDLITDKFKKRGQVAATVESELIKQEKSYRGFGGWLYLFAAGLVYQFLFNLKAVYDNYLMTKTENFEYLTTIGNENYNSLWEPTILFEILGESIIVIFVVLIAYFCIKQSLKFKTVSIIFITTSFILQSIDLLLLLNIQNGYSEDLFGSTIYDGIYRSIVYAIVWIPYLLLSKRVKNTFIK